MGFYDAVTVFPPKNVSASRVLQLHITMGGLLKQRNLGFFGGGEWGWWIYILHFFLVECCFIMYPETVGLLGTGAQDGHLNFHAVPEFNFALSMT